MSCSYFRHINLHEIYAQLEDYSYFSGPELSNIQYQFGEALSCCFEELSHATFPHHQDDAWTILPPDVVAAEVGDAIEADLELLATVADIELPTRRASARSAINKLAVLSIHASFGEVSFARLTSLVVYQYDLLCWLYRKNKIAEAFEVYELILRTQGQREIIYSRSFDSVKQSEIARERAKKRHAPTNEKKSRLLAEWDSSSTEYKSRADFCRIVSQREHIIYRTLYDWVAAHDRFKD